MSANGDKGAFAAVAFGDRSAGCAKSEGLTKREYFAAAALQGIMANPERWKQIALDYTSGKKNYEQCSKANATKAVSLADALLAALGADHAQ